MNRSEIHGLKAVDGIEYHYTVFKVILHHVHVLFLIGPGKLVYDEERSNVS